MCDRVYFTDERGVTWSVVEQDVDSGECVVGHTAPGTSWLSFESDLEVRRLWHFPDDWRRMADWQLETLLGRASTMIARFPRTARHQAVPSPPRDDASRHHDHR